MNFLKLRNIIIFIYLFSLKFDFGISYKTNINRFSNFQNISPNFIEINSISLKTPENFENKKQIIQNKIRSFLQIIRAKNIPATTFLCFTGGWIMNPYFSLFQNSQLWISSFITVLIMSANMAINDIFDLEIDRINSPARPLVTGEISVNEAIRYTVGLIGMTEVLNIRFLPVRLHWIIHSAVVFTLIYTPVLKRILFLKNISCAIIVSFSLFFTGIVTTRLPFSIHPNRAILLIACNTIFSGSLTNEILMDMRDYTGDKLYNISTISTYFGKEIGYKLTKNIMYLNLFINSVILERYFNWKVIIIYFLLFIPQLRFLQKIGENREYSNLAIRKYMSQTNKTLVFLLLYFCILAI